MNKKILIALALASIFLSASATLSAVVCTKTGGGNDANCASCPNTAAGTCTACNAGYFLSTATATLGNCIQCGDTTGCKTCTSATAGSCTVAATGYLLSATPGTPAACGTRCATCTVAGDAAKCLTCASGAFLGATTGTPAVGSCTACTDPVGCAVCADATAAKDCTTPATGYFLDTTTNSPTAGQGTATICAGNTAGGATACNKCADTVTPGAAAKCQTANTNYFLASVTSGAGTATICNDPNCGVCSSATVCTTCTKGTLDSNTNCCGVQNCAACDVAANTNPNNVCITCSAGYGLINSGAGCASCSSLSAGCSACPALAAAPTVIGTCTACKSGYTNTATSGAAVCVATTPNPSTDSPSTAAFNVTPTATFLSTETSTPAFTGISGPVVHGPGFDSSTEYVWAINVPTTTGVISINRRTLNGTYGGSLAKLNGTADVAITTSVASTTGAGLTAVAPGYFAFASYVAGTNWGNPTVGGVVTVATASEISVTYVAVNGTSATTKAITGNTNTGVYFQVNSLWIDTGVIYITYAMATHTAGAASPAAVDTFAVNGIYIQGITISTGALLYNTTGGVKAITITQSVSGTAGTTCVKNGDSGCATNPLLSPTTTSVSSFTTGGTNITNSTTVNYLWSDKSGTGNYQVIKTGTITLATGAATSGTALSTEAAATGTFLTASATAPYVMTSYYPAGFLGSYATSGVFIGKLVATFTGAATPAYTYTVQGYINGSSTAASNVTLVSGYTAPLITGYGTSDGFVLVETHVAQTTPTNKQSNLVQIERFFTNGSTNGAAVNLGTYQDAPQTHQDGNGSIYLGYYTVDQNSGKTYAGMLGKYLAQSLASGASTLTSIFAFLSLMIVALFAF